MQCWWLFIPGKKLFMAYTKTIIQQPEQFSTEDPENDHQSNGVI